MVVEGRVCREREREVAVSVVFVSHCFFTLPSCRLLRHRSQVRVMRC